MCWEIENNSYYGISSCLICLSHYFALNVFVLLFSVQKHNFVIFANMR